MRWLFVLLLALLVAVPASAENFDGDEVASACAVDGGVLCSVTAVSIADGDTGYLYPFLDGDISNSGIFSSQLSLGSTTDVVSVAVNMQTKLSTNALATWGDAHSTTSTDQTFTTSGVTEPFRLSADIPGRQGRIKLVNNTGTGEAVTINWGVFCRWRGK